MSYFELIEDLHFEVRGLVDDALSGADVSNDKCTFRVIRPFPHGFMKAFWMVVGELQNNPFRRFQSGVVWLNSCHTSVRFSKCATKFLQTGNCA
jgi:hypothetical protein